MKFIHFDSIDSTNTWVKSHLGELDPNGMTCVSASMQTAGYGQFHRTWVSPKDLNVYATFYFTLPKEQRTIANLAQLISLSVAKYLISLGFKPLIKWPNDLLLDEKKAGGVLCETQVRGHFFDIILGVGLNVNMPPNKLRKIDQPATSLYEVGGREFDTDSVLKGFSNVFQEDLSLYRKKGFDPFLPEYNTLLAYKGEQISIDSEIGICHSLTAEGYLNVLLPSGEIKAFRTGKLKSIEKTDRA